MVNKGSINARGFLKPEGLLNSLKGCLNIQNLSELIWKMDITTFRELDSDPGNCISVEDDLKLDMCVEYQGKNYGFMMNYDKELIWKMDVGTFKEIH